MNTGIMAAEGQAKLLPSAVRIAPHNVIVTLPDGSEVCVLQLQDDTPMNTFLRRRSQVRDTINQLQRELDKLDTAVGIIARESQA